MIYLKFMLVEKIKSMVLKMFLNFVKANIDHVWEERDLTLLPPPPPPTKSLYNFGTIVFIPKLADDFLRLKKHVTNKLWSQNFCTVKDIFYKFFGLLKLPLNKH